MPMIYQLLRNDQIHYTIGIIPNAIGYPHSNLPAFFLSQMLRNFYMNLNENFYFSHWLARQLFIHSSVIYDSIVIWWEKSIVKMLGLWVQLKNSSKI